MPGTYVCWVCRKALQQELDETAKLGWAKCVRCSKTREQREPPPAPKQQPLSKREEKKLRQRAIAEAN